MRYLLILLIVVTTAHAGLFGRRPQPATLVISNQTLYPGTTYYFPSGNQADEASWYNVGEAGSAPSLYGFGLRADSVLGFDADSSGLTIEAVFGFEQSADSVRYDYGDDNIVTHWYVWNDTTTFLARTDIGRLINRGLPVHERRRYKVTVNDTLKVSTFYEIPARP